MLRLVNISKRFGGTVALDGANLELKAGEIHALAGENGSGKSTLMKVLAGIHRPDTGQIFLEEQETRFPAPHDAMQAGIAMVHQELNLVPALSAAENLYLGQEERNAVGLVKTRSALTHAQQLFRELEIRADPRELVENLSMATRQMIEIARALTHRARIIILDEPTSALSDSEVEVLFRILRRLRADGTSLVYISHKMAEVFALADRYTVLRDGKTVASGLIADVTERELVHSMVGRKLGDYYPPRRAVQADASVILEVQDVNRWSASRQILKGISFSLRRGEILGIAGLVGAGRTEILETLFGAAGQSWSGTIRLEGQVVRPGNSAQAIRHGIALVTEDRAGRGLFFQQSVLSNATIAYLPKLVRLGVIAGARERQAFSAHADSLRIRRASDDTAVEFLSGGNQQKVILARWLMTKPRLLLLDEPTRGIDVGTKAEIYRVLRELADAGIGVLFVSSEMPEVLGLADRILVLSGGQISGEFAASQATEQQILEAAMANMK